MLVTVHLVGGRADPEGAPLPAPLAELEPGQMLGSALNLQTDGVWIARQQQGRK